MLHPSWQKKTHPRQRLKLFRFSHSSLTFLQVFLFRSTCNISRNNWTAEAGVQQADQSGAGSDWGNYTVMLLQLHKKKKNRQTGHSKHSVGSRTLLCQNKTSAPLTELTKEIWSHLLVTNASLLSLREEERRHTTLGLTALFMAIDCSWYWPGR